MGDQLSLHYSICTVFSGSVMMLSFPTANEKCGLIFKSLTFDVSFGLELMDIVGEHPK